MDNNLKRMYEMHNSIGLLKSSYDSYGKSDNPLTAKMRDVAIEVDSLIVEFKSYLIANKIADIVQFLASQQLGVGYAASVVSRPIPGDSDETREWVVFLTDPYNSRYHYYDPKLKVVTDRDTNKIMDDLHSIVQANSALYGNDISRWDTTAYKGKIDVVG